MKLAIVSTHPIQYNAPFFRRLAQEPEIDLHVFYTWEQAASGPKFDPGFGRAVEWDIPLLEGYEYSFVKNTASEPGSHHYKGIINPSLIEDIKKWKPDVLLVYGWNFNSHLACLRYFHGKIPVWFRGDSTLLDEKPGIKKMLRRLLLRWVYKHVDRALYVGTRNREYFLAHGLKESELIFVPHAIDNTRFSEPNEVYEQEAAEWRRQLGIGPADKVILFAGKLEPKKNPFFLLELARKLKDKNTWILIAGNGPLEKALKDEAKGLERVVFLDFQNQQKMPVLYRVGDLFVLPSKGPGETWGLAVNEAMACRRPVMVSIQCGCAADLVKEGENGFILDPFNPEKSAETINRIFAASTSLKSAGEKSFRMVQSYSLEAAARNLTAALIGIDPANQPGEHIN